MSAIWILQLAYDLGHKAMQLPAESQEHYEGRLAGHVEALDALKALDDDFDIKES